MRKLLLITMLLAALAVSLPASAQQPGSIIDTAARDGRFTTFVAAINAADLDDMLRAGGPYTVFAPTDAAFADFMAALNMRPGEFLGDRDFLRNLLLYHVVEGLVPATAGAAAVESLLGEAIALRSTVEGVVLNDGALIVRGDIPASNGIIHAIDEVLLPAPDVAVVAEPVLDGPAYVRLAHFSEDMPPVDVFVDGGLTGLAVLSRGDISEWVPFTPGLHRLAFVPQGELIEEAIFGPVDVVLEPGTWTTVAAIGSELEDTLRLAVLDQDVEAALVPGYARVTLFNSIGDIAGIDLTVGDNIVLMDDVGYGEYAVLDLPEGLYDFNLVLSGPVQPILTTAAGMRLEAGNHYLLGAAGTPDLASVAVKIVPAREIAMLLGLDEEPVVDAAIEPIASQGSLFEIAAMEQDLSIFVSAAQVAGLEDVLRRAGPLTVFAPTNSAFASLPEGTMELLMERPIALSNLLRYHMIPGQLEAADLVTQPTADTILGLPMAFQLRGATPLLNGSASFVATNIGADNGIMHVIDSVLMPPLD